MGEIFSVHRGRIPVLVGEGEEMKRMLMENWGGREMVIKELPAAFCVFSIVLIFWYQRFRTVIDSYY
uniref:Uncharacterized protein n=1 Tax=Oryza sativa subsp. japonica TaxID=39947 RepID=Q10CV1_ORYSJ|nr:hypothetical protein LOC_Os03g56784 [Oryza sativa Japonica Group]